jgi:para-aminobenzoate synthetase/4-amino-4-deoxychorismate lyase
MTDDLPTPSLPVPNSLRLLETMRFDPHGGYVLLADHLRRLQTSARRFGWTVDIPGIERLLEQNAAGGASRVRLLVDAHGVAAVEIDPLDALPDRPLRVAMSVDPVHAASPWLYYKTTPRDLYDRALRARPGCDDVLLWNEQGELTEATRFNVVVESEDGFVTPPLRCGLLPGVLRGWLLAHGRIREEVVPIQGLASRRLWLINSVRGWCAAELV